MFYVVKCLEVALYHQIIYQKFCTFVSCPCFDDKYVFNVQ